MSPLFSLMAMMVVGGYMIGKRHGEGRRFAILGVAPAPLVLARN